jgi:DNA-binding response OmpR family regulator
MVERLTDGDTAIGNKEITLGAVRINPKTHRVFVKNVEVELKNKEYELLLFLVLNADSVFSKETLYERIWGMDSYGDNATIAVHINRIREKIETDPSSPQYIQTVWGAGYRFKA